MRREQSDDRVNNEGKSRFASGPLRNWGEGGVFLTYRTLALVICSPGFWFCPDFPVDCNCASVGNLSSCKPWNLGYWLLSCCWLPAGKGSGNVNYCNRRQFFCYSYTETSNLICYIGLPYKRSSVLLLTPQSIVVFYMLRAIFSFSHVWMAENLTVALSGRYRRANDMTCGTVSARTLCDWELVPLSALVCFPFCF